MKKKPINKGFLGKLRKYSKIKFLAHVVKAKYQGKIEE